MPDSLKVQCADCYSWVWIDQHMNVCDDEDCETEHECDGTGDPDFE